MHHNFDNPPHRVRAWGLLRVQGMEYGDYRKDGHSNGQDTQ